MKTSRSILMLVAALAASTAACEKNAVQLIAGPQEGGAAVKFFNFAVGSPAVNFFINNTKVTAIASTSCFSRDPLVNPNIQQCETTGIESASGTGYGSSANSANAWYSDVAPGQISISGRIAAATDKNVPIATTQATVAGGKFYSFYLSGTYDAGAKAADAFVIEDVMPEVDPTTAYVRFVNSSSTSQPMTLFAKNRTTGEEVAIGGATAYKSGTAFVKLPSGGYDLAVRTAAGTNVITRTAVSWDLAKVYTITARGDVAANTGLALDNTANR